MSFALVILDMFYAGAKCGVGAFLNNVSFAQSVAGVDRVVRAT